MARLQLVVRLFALAAVAFGQDGRRGAFLETTGTFSVSEANRAGNSEDLGEPRDGAFLDNAPVANELGESKNEDKCPKSVRDAEAKWIPKFPTMISAPSSPCKEYAVNSQGEKLYSQLTGSKVAGGADKQMCKSCHESECGAWMLRLHEGGGICKASGDSLQTTDAFCFNLNWKASAKARTAEKRTFLLADGARPGPGTDTNFVCSRKSITSSVFQIPGLAAKYVGHAGRSQVSCMTAKFTKCAADPRYDPKCIGSTTHTCSPKLACSVEKTARCVKVCQKFANGSGNQANAICTTDSKLCKPSYCEIIAAYT